MYVQLLGINTRYCG